MQTRIYAAAAAIFFAAIPILVSAQGADRYRCTFGELERRIEIFRETGVTVPCEVHYYKDTEEPGDQQVLWRAQTEEGYCDTRTEAFLEQLSDWGWSCDAAESAREQTISEDAAVDESAMDEAADQDDGA